MNCKYCNKEISEGFQFCPFCGKKAPKEEKLVLRNTDWLRFATIEELNAFLPELKIMTSEEFQMWVLGMHENIRVFEIKISYRWHFTDGGKTEWYKHCLSGLSAQETKKKICEIKSRGDVITGVFVKERNLSKTLNEAKEGITWFRTKEECEEAIRTIKEYGG